MRQGRQSPFQQFTFLLRQTPLHHPALQLVRNPPFSGQLTNFHALFNLHRHWLFQQYHKLSHQYDDHPSMTVSPPSATPSNSALISVSLYEVQGSSKRLPGKLGNYLGFECICFVWKNNATSHCVIMVPRQQTTPCGLFVVSFIFSCYCSR